MEELIEARVTPAQVWQAWEKVHVLEEGKTGKDKFRYKVLNVKKGESFSILWKSLFVRLIFTQSVKPTSKGSEIRYHVQAKGLFGWAIRLFLGPKIKQNISHVLKAVVKDLESQSVK